MMLKTFNSNTVQNFVSRDNPTIKKLITRLNQEINDLDLVSNKSSFFLQDYNALLNLYPRSAGSPIDPMTGNEMPEYADISQYTGASKQGR